MGEVFKRTFLDLRVAETDEGRGYWLDQPWIPDAQRPSLLAAPIMVVPTLRLEEGPVFPSGTSEFIDRFREALDDQAAIAVAMSAEGYQELALHSKAWRLPTLVFSTVVLPIVIGILTNRIDDLLPGHKDEDVAEVEFVIEAPDHRAMKVTFKGDPEEIGKFLSEVTPKFIASIDDEADPPAPPPKAATSTPTVSKP